MPMVPGPLAAATLGVVKLVGYGAFAYVVNSRVDDRANPVAFGVVKTSLGFVGNLGYVAVLAFIHGQLASDSMPSSLVAFVGVVPIRLAMWVLALRICYRVPALQHRWLLQTAALGVVWSFALDGVMWFLHHFFSWMPGMTMPVC